MSECNHDCSSCSENCSEKDLKTPFNKDSSVKKVYAVISGKGGVGKSSVTSLLAVAEARKGKKSSYSRRGYNGTVHSERFRYKRTRRIRRHGYSSGKNQNGDRNHVHELSSSGRNRSRCMERSDNSRRDTAVLEGRKVGEYRHYVHRLSSGNRRRSSYNFPVAQS